jgi:hypothetical protein
MEQKIKNLLGEYGFIIASLQHQLETAQNELNELKSKNETQSKTKADK